MIGIKHGKQKSLFQKQNTLHSKFLRVDSVKYSVELTLFKYYLTLKESFVEVSWSFYTGETLH